MRTSNRFKTTIVTKNLSNIILNSDIITTPCEKVLSIIRQAKNFIFNIAKTQTKLIQNLEWCIKIITSHSLYSYELKEKEAISQISQGNPEFKQLVDFVSEYNEKVIKMNRKYNILSDKLLQKSSTKLNKRKIERKNSFGEKDSHFSKALNLDDLEKQNKLIDNINDNKPRDKTFERRKTVKIPSFQNDLYFNTLDNLNNTNTNYNKYIKIDKNNPFSEGALKRKINLKKGKKKLININDEKNINKTNMNKNNNNDSISNSNISTKLNNSNYLINKLTKINNNSKNKFGKNNQKFLVSFDHNYLNKKSKNMFPSVQKISITINNDNNGAKELSGYNPRKTSNNHFNSVNSVNISLTNSIVYSDNNTSNNNSTNNNSINKNKKENHKKKNEEIPSKAKSRKNIPHFKEYSYMKFENKLIHEGYDISKLITEKNFDIFKLKDLIEYNNVLPMVGRTILENLGLLDEDILNISKLDTFLISVSNQYKQETLYHNSMHGSDVTQSVYIFITHSNAEKIAKTNVLDLLSIIIAALGHDIAHPGLTNTFHINDSTDIAITYNDISVLENFHASTLFKTLRKTENNIFEKLTTIDYKMIRKRMISEILATDMANHGKVISLIKSKIVINENKETKLNLLSGNEQSKIEEQQCLLDYMIHLADLAHNTKLFDISLQWVSLLSEEFWRQGDLEKELNLPVSFLCDREDINIPKSQKGFISGYVIPTFETLVKIFPTLRFTLDNANNNLKEWQKLMDEGRKRGWTPKKDETCNKQVKLSKSITNGKVLLETFSPLNKNKNKIKDKNNNINNSKESKNIIKKIEKIKNTKENNSRNGTGNNNTKNNLNLSYNSKKNKKFIEINKDNEILNNTEVINTKKNPIHKTIKSEHINKGILRINKNKLNIKENKKKIIRFQTDENVEKKDEKRINNKNV